MTCTYDKCDVYLYMYATSVYMYTNVTVYKACLFFSPYHMYICHVYLLVYTIMYMLTYDKVSHVHIVQ